MKIVFTEKSALFSNDRIYRYTLWRRWNEGALPGYVMFIGLNPSTADEIIEDPTVRRCIGYTRDWGYSHFCMTNIFAFRATLPSVMKVQKDPVGSENDFHLQAVAKNADKIITTWGTHGKYMDRGRQVLELINNDLHKVFHLGLTKDGNPKHPLYLRRDIKPISILAKL
jgi:hypothetical protein